MTRTIEIEHGSREAKALERLASEKPKFEIGEEPRDLALEIKVVRRLAPNVVFCFSGSWRVYRAKDGRLVLARALVGRRPRYGVRVEVGELPRAVAKSL